MHFVAVVPMRTGDTPADTATAIQDLVDHYERGARTGGRAEVSLVVGLNRADAQTGTGGTGPHIDAHLAGLPGSLRSSIPVTVVGAGWTSHSTDRRGVPFGAIRQQLANHPEVAQQAHGPGAARTYLHFGDGDVRSMLTPDGRGVLVRAGEVLGGDDGPRLLSGGYRLPDEHGATTLESAQDAAVRQVFADTDPSLNYFPEPNTFYRVDTGPGEQTLSPGHDFGAFDQEGQHLVDTVRRTDGDDALAWNGDLSIATDPTRVNQNGHVDPQSHATANGWSNRVGPWLANQRGVSVDGQRLNALAAVATDPSRPITDAQPLVAGIRNDLVAQGWRRPDAAEAAREIYALVGNSRNAIRDAAPPTVHHDAQAPGPVPQPRSAPPATHATDRGARGPQWHEGPTAPARTVEHPTPPAAFEHRRDGAPVTRVQTESFRVQRGPDGGLEHHGSLLRSEVVAAQHEVRRIQADDGTWIHEATVPVHLEGDPAVVADVRARATAAVGGLNGRYRLPNGDQLQVRLEDRPAGDGVTTVQVHAGEGRSDQRTWYAGEPDPVFVHESLHALGLHDGYRGDAALGGQVDTVGVMGHAAAHGGPVHLTDADLRRLQDVVAATAVVRDHPLAPPGPATVATPGGGPPRIPDDGSDAGSVRSGVSDPFVDPPSGSGSTRSGSPVHDVEDPFRDPSSPSDASDRWSDSSESAPDPADAWRATVDTVLARHGVDDLPGRHEAVATLGAHASGGPGDPGRSAASAALGDVYRALRDRGLDHAAAHAVRTDLRDEMRRAREAATGEAHRDPRTTFRPRWDEHDGPVPAPEIGDAAPRSSWEHRRADAPTTTVASTTLRLLRDGSDRLIREPDDDGGYRYRAYTGTVALDVRHIQADDGSWVLDLTVPVHLTGPAEHLGPVLARAEYAVGQLNDRYRLPGGSQLHVRLEQRPAGTGALPVTLVDGPGRSDQTTWHRHDTTNALAHEVMHTLGLPDGYRMDEAVLGGRIDRHGIMGPSALAPDHEPPRLTAENLHRIEDTVFRAGPLVRDHALGAPPVAAPAAPRAAGPTPTSTAPRPPVPPGGAIEMADLAPPVPPEDASAVPDQRRVTSVDDVAAVHAEVRAALGLRDDQQLTGHAALDDALTRRPATLHGDGRRFTVQVDGSPREVRVAVEAAGDGNPGAPTGRQEHASGGVDRPRGTQRTGDASPEVRASVTAGAVVGPSATVGGSVSLARPTLGRAEATTTVRDTRVAVLDTAAPQVGHARVAVATGDGPARPAVLVPAHVGTPAPGGDAPTRPGGPVVGSLELAAPVGPARVGRTDDGRDPFDAARGDLHPAITREGAPGRRVLDTVTSAAGVTERMPELLGGRWVDAPDLVSADGHRVGGVRLRLVDPRLTPYDTADGVLEAEARGTSDPPVTTSTRTGGDSSVGVGAGTTLPPVGGSAQLTASGGAHHGAEVRTSTPVSTRRRAEYRGTVEGHLLRGTLEVQVPGHDAHRVPVEQVLRMSPWQAERALGGHRDPAGDRRPPRFLELGHGIGSGRVLGVGQVVPGPGGGRAGLDLADHVGQRLRALGLDGLAPDADAAFSGAGQRGPAGRRDVPGATDRSGAVAADRDLRAAFSPERLAHEFDAMLGDGYRTTFVERGWFRTRRVEVTVRAHLGDLTDGGPVPGTTLGSTRVAEDRHGVVHSADRSVGVGLDGRVNLPVYVGDQRVMPAPNAGVRAMRTTAETSSGDPGAGRSVLLGDRDARAFHATATYEVEVTTHSRVRRWVRRTTPGLPGTTDPAWWPWRSRTDTTSAGNERITVLTAEAATRPPAEDGRPDDGEVGPPETRPLSAPRTLEQVLTGPPAPGPRVLEIEAFGGGRALADAARDALREASGGDEAVIGRGTPSADRISAAFGPQRLAEPGVLDHGSTLPGLRHGRRVADRVAEVGMKLDLQRPVLASDPTTVLTREGVSGTGRASGTTRTTHTVEASAGLVVGVNGTQQLGGAYPSSGPGPLAADSTRVSHGRSRHDTRGDTVTGTTERSENTPGRDVVLVRFDAVAEIVAESRNRGTVHDTVRGDGVGRAAREVRLPGAVHAWVAREEAARLGLLPGRPEPARDAGPAVVPPGLAGDRLDLGSGVVTSRHDLRPLVGDLRGQLRAAGHGELLPSSMLEDRMQTLHRTIALTGDHAVRGLLEQATRDGVPIEVPSPRTLGRDDDRIVLRARPAGPARVVDVVHDGTGTHLKATGTVTTTHGAGRDATTGVAAAITPQHRWGGSEPNHYGQVGGGIGASVSDRHGTTSTDTTTTEDVTQTTTSGPTAVVDRPYAFILEYRRGDQILAATDPREQIVTVRVPADDVTTGAAGAPPRRAEPPFPFVGDRDDAALARWRAGGRDVPPTAGVLTSPDGAADLLTHALRDAGAGTSLTGPTAPAHAAIAQVTAPEARAATLHRLLREGLPVPGLAPTGAVGGQHATATLHGRLHDLRWGAPSQGEMRGAASRVAGTATAVADTVSGAVDVRPVEGGGGTFRPDASLQATGEVRGPAASGDTRTTTTVPGHDGSSRAKERTWTVVADLDLLAVASVRDRTGLPGREWSTAAWQTRAPGAVTLRMTESDARVLLGDPPPDLVRRQEEQTARADDWQAAETGRRDALAERGRGPAGESVDELLDRRRDLLVRARATGDPHADELRELDARLDRARAADRRDAELAERIAAAERRVAAARQAWWDAKRARDAALDAHRAETLPAADRAPVLPMPEFGVVDWPADLRGDPVPDPEPAPVVTADPPRLPPPDVGDPFDMDAILNPARTGGPAD